MFVFTCVYVYDEGGLFKTDPSVRIVAAVAVEKKTVLYMKGLMNEGHVFVRNKRTEIVLLLIGWPNGLD